MERLHISNLRETAGEAASLLRNRLSDNRQALGEINMGEKWQKGKLITLALWGRTSRRVRMIGATFFILAVTTYLSHILIEQANVSLPSVSLQYGQPVAKPKFNHSKVALLIENRPNPILAPLMLHFIAVVPPDWRFRFMGSLESVEHINKSAAIRSHVKSGKLDLTYIPSNMTTGSQEEISRFLTTLWLYETVLQPAEWLLVFQTDSILCANSKRNLNEYLEYDWVGAPWSTNARYGGNGGLSLRRVSAIVEILRHQKRVDGSDPEDVWLSDRLGHRPGSKLANGTVSVAFSGEQYQGSKVDVHAPVPNHEGGVTENKPPGNETLQHSSNSTAPANIEPAPYVEGVDDWRHGFYEPMGYHTGGGGAYLHRQVWGTPELRKHIWDYCPEVKMTLKMDAAKYVPGDCGSKWKRWDNGAEGGDEEGWETEVIDGQEYPVLRGLIPF